MSNFQVNNTCTCAPFVLNTPLPFASEKLQVVLAKWETQLRGIEERLMTSIFGMIPNVIWASILASVFEKAEQQIEQFDVNQPRKCGCPWKGCASRILPKGALGISPSKPVHDDNNRVISLSCWASLTESNEETDLAFLVSGFQVSIRATS